MTDSAKNEPGTPKPTRRRRVTSPRADVAAAGDAKSTPPVTAASDVPDMPVTPTPSISTPATAHQETVMPDTGAPESAATDPEARPSEDPLGDAIEATTAALPAGSVAGRRVPELSYFFPAHNEEANLEGLVEEALAELPKIAERFEIIAVNDGSHDRTAEIADALAARHAGIVRVVHHPTNLGYGAALRSGFQAAQYPLVAFTDGDRQFQVADIARLTDRLVEADSPDVVVGFRIERADPFIRRLYARVYRFANRIWFGLQVRDIDCACKLFRRDALRSIRVESGGAFFTAEMLIKLHAAGQSIAEVGVPHYPRTAGSPTGAKPSVVFRAMRDFWMLRLRMWANRKRALRRGAAMAS